MEIWNTIEDFPDYNVSNFGRIKSLKFGKEKILKQWKNNDYMNISLLNNKKRKVKSVHILVFEVFNNYKLQNNECVHHRDNNKENNNLKNLKKMIICEHHSLHNKNKIFSENHKINLSKSHMNKYHSVETKKLMSKKQREDNNPNCKITKQQVKLIKELLYQNKKCTEISKLLNISKYIIYDIKNNRSWKHI